MERSALISSLLFWSMSTKQRLQEADDNSILYTAPNTYQLDLWPTKCLRPMKSIALPVLFLKNCCRPRSEEPIMKVEVISTAADGAKSGHFACTTTRCSNLQVGCQTLPHPPDQVSQQQWCCHSLWLPFGGSPHFLFLRLCQLKCWHRSKETDG